MTMPLMALCDLMAGTPLALMSQPFCQIPATGVTVTSVLRLIASLLARLRLAYNSKLAFFARWFWVIDWKLGTAIVASIPAITTTTSNSGRVKPNSIVRNCLKMFLPGSAGAVRFGARAVQGQIAIARLTGACYRRCRDGKRRWSCGNNDCNVVVLGDIGWRCHSQRGE